VIACGGSYEPAEPPGFGPVVSVTVLLRLASATLSLGLVSRHHSHHSHVIKMIQPRHEPDLYVEDALVWLLINSSRGTVSSTPY